jgi:hypothetical protein
MHSTQNSKNRIGKEVNQRTLTKANIRVNLHKDLIRMVIKRTCTLLIRNTRLINNNS